MHLSAVQVAASVHRPARSNDQVQRSGQWNPHKESYTRDRISGRVRQYCRNAARPGRMDGTWVGGWDQNAGIQLTFAGGTLIGFYWRDDYKDVRRATNTPDGGKRFAWDKGDATLTRTPDGDALLVVREGGASVSIILKRE